jgi:RNA polymerase sigma factor (sigma-70 family)
MQTSTRIHGQGSTVGLNLEDVVESYYKPLYQFALSLAHSEVEASDLTQQTFYIWQLKGEQLRDQTKVKAWLFTTLHRAFLQGRRRATRFPHYELGNVEAELPWVAADEGRDTDSIAAVAALAEVDAIFRAPLALFYLQDYAYKDIALILDVPLGTVKSRIARGIKQLQEVLRTRECYREPVAA